MLCIQGPLKETPNSCPEETQITASELKTKSHELTGVSSLVMTITQNT